MNVRLYNGLIYLFALILAFCLLPILYGSSSWHYKSWWMLASFSMTPLWAYRFYIYQALASAGKSEFSRGPHAIMFRFGYIICVFCGFIGLFSVAKLSSYVGAGISSLMIIGLVGVLALTGTMPIVLQRQKVNARVLSEFKLAGNLSVGFALLFMLLLFWWLTTPTVYPSG